MKKIYFQMYSYSPRFRCEFTWITDLVPSVGDVILVPNEYLSELSKVHFENQRKHKFNIELQVVSRKFIVEKKDSYWSDCDIKITLGFTEDEKNRIDSINKKNSKN